MTQQPIATASVQSQPITKTHSTLLKSRFGLYKIDPRVADFTQKEVQAFTVDIAKYNHICSKYEAVIKRTDVEVVRLQKELKEINLIHNRWRQLSSFMRGAEEGERRSYEQLNALKLELCRAKENMKSAQRLAIAEGERRAIEKVKVALLQSEENSKDLFTDEVRAGILLCIKELHRIEGLGEVQR